MDIEKLKLGLWTAALGAFFMFGIGFGVLGWVFGGTAQQQQHAAIVDRLTPICVAQATRDPMEAQKLQALRKLPYDQRAKFVAGQGWATMPGESQPDGAVAEKCGDKISG